MIGTDFHPGIKGIGPKTGLKLIREYKTIEAVCEAKGKELPERLDEIREIFNNLAKENDYNIFFPSLYLCTDNGAMIAYAGLERLKRKKTNSLEFKPKPRWPLDPNAVFLKGKRVDE